MIDLILKIAKALALDFGEHFAPHAKAQAASLYKLMMIAAQIEFGGFDRDERIALFHAEVRALKGLVYEAEQAGIESIPSVTEILAIVAKTTF